MQASEISMAIRRHNINKKAQTCEMDLICFWNELSSKLG